MPIPPEYREIINTDPYFKTCARKNEDCGGRITIEHVFLYKGRKIEELWAYLPLCERHHSLGKWLTGGGLLNKRINAELSVARATPEDLAKYPRKDFSIYQKHD